MAELKLLTDRGSFTREVADFPEGFSDDGVRGFTVAGKKYVRTKRGRKFKSEEIGIWPGTDMTSKLQSRFDHESINVIELDSEDGDITNNGTLTIPVGKSLVLTNGTCITGTGTITGAGTFRARKKRKAFDTGITVSGILPDDNVITPQMFGAVADWNGSTGTDDGPAFQRMFDYITTLSNVFPKVEIPAGRYLINTTVNLPDMPNSSNLFLEISGYGAELKTTQPIAIFKRIKSDWADTTVMDKYNCTIKGVKFFGNSSYSARAIGQMALNIGACYSWTFADMHINNFDDGFVAEFFLSCKIHNIRFTNCTNTGFTGRFGTWTGASMTNSAFNANELSGLRFYNARNSFASIYLLAADQTIIRNTISEGNNPQYNFYVDYNNSTGVNLNTFENIWIESTGSGTILQNTNFFLKTKGTTVLKNIQRIYPNQFMDISLLHSSSYVLVDNIPYMGNRPTSGKRFFNAGSDLSGRRIKFQNIEFANSEFIKDPSNWEGDFVPRNLELECTITGNGGTVDYNRGIKFIESGGTLLLSSRTLQTNVSSQYMIIAGSLHFAADNTYNIGGASTTNVRPARVSANRFLADVNSTYGFAFGDNTANPVEYITRPSAGVIRMTAQALDLPMGTTAERPANAARRLRYNTETGLVEWNNGTTWLSCVSLTSTQTLTNKTLGTGTKIDLGTVAPGDMYYGDSSGNLVKVPRGSIGQVWAVLSETVLGWKNDASGGGSASGSGVESIRTVTADTTFTDSDGILLVDTSVGNVNISINPLPAGKPASIKKITPDANLVTITPTSGTIDGDTSRTLDAYNECILLKSNGTNLFIFNN